MHKEAEITRADVSKALDTVRKYTMSPLGLGIRLGAVGAGLGYATWDDIVNTGGSLGRWPIKKLTGMSDDDYDEAMDELKQDNRYKWILPSTLGAILGGGYLAHRYNTYHDWKSMLDWAPKTASLHKEADELFTYGGYVPKIDFSQVINANQAKSMFSNDPQLQKDPYVRNMGLAIINNAANKAGFVNPTLGNIYDSAAEKMKQKLSFSGVMGIAANTMIANATAHLFTSALGAVVPLSKETKRNLIDAGTWYAAVKSILT
jgi:hypothetical protein